MRTIPDINIEEFRLGKKDTFRLIFNTLYPGMCLFSRKYLMDHGDAEDVVQDVFVELWNQKEKFVSFEQIKAFLYLSIKNKCINFLKHLRVKEKYEQNMNPDYSAEFEEHVIEAEVISNLNSAINNLPGQQKQVIMLSLEGMKNEEIAQNMQISLNTVKHYKKIAYQHIKENVNPLLSALLIF